MKEIPEWSKVHSILFDFDGVFTDNKVNVSEEGVEHVTCSRADGLGIAMLKKFINLNHWDLRLAIVSTEENPVVRRRADKMGITCYNGVKNKFTFTSAILRNDKLPDFSGIIYLGNDLNDLSLFETDCYSVAPIDAHERIKATASMVINEKGGAGFVRAFVEKLLRIDQMSDVDLHRLL
ncbi:3-deoxy-D-manno-octulosonate 8-phosphate phosphatase KdsC [Lachnospiraceae bacterium]|nr:3-deoxy-D-manno-octulosonate 8-phosphate phosphatase KdsC [Lachnospiraceae bacterium]